jgi:hypothetical protein
MDHEATRILQLKGRVDAVLAAARATTVRVPLSMLGASPRDALLLAELYRREGRSALLRTGHLVVRPPTRPPWWLRWLLALRWLLVRRAALPRLAALPSGSRDRAER